MKATEHFQRFNSLMVSFLCWFDSDHQLEVENLQKIDWIRSFPFLAIHALCIGICWYAITLPAFMVLCLSYFLRMFAITGFYHRYFSHRAFKTSRVLQFLLAFLGGMAAQRGAIWWAAHHRLHHKYSDGEQDHHSPGVLGFFNSHVRWFLQKNHFSYDRSVVKDLTRYPELLFLNRFDLIPPLFFLMMLFSIGELLSQQFQMNCSGMQFIVWGFGVATVILYHSTFLINSLAHLYGKRRFPTKDNSRNSWFLALLTLGEGWHNNHHYWPSSARQGFRFFEIDITYYLLKLLKTCRLIWDIRLPPPEVLNGQVLNQR